MIELHVLLTDEFYPKHGRIAPEISQVKEGLN
jgi:hypothetical protein